MITNATSSIHPFPHITNNVTTSLSISNKLSRSVDFLHFYLFWHIHNKHIMSFKMICNMAYIHLNFTETISKPIGRFLLGLISRSCDSESRKGRNNRMRNLTTNIQSEKAKIFNNQVPRKLPSANIIIWRISWPSDSFL